MAPQPIRAPPTRSRVLTPREPKLSTFPNPNGNLSVGGLSAQETVASVMKSLTRSVRLWTASADRAETY
jgi:hypothetical protein